MLRKNALVPLLLAFALCSAGAARAGEGERASRPPLETPPGLPEAYKQLIPRGGIPAIDAPVFVSAAEAEISDEAWVLGIVVDGQAKAYSLNLLNHHEIVNDRLGDLPVAAVW